jgi:hypothetical protein
MYISDTVLRIGKGGCSGVVKNVISSTILRHNTDRVATGSLVRVLVGPQSLAPSTYSLTWDGRDDAGRRVAPGVYFWRLVSENSTLTRKAIKID